jgi:deazaflavin-dependent oxidoreductase (nitroreductase family)
MYDESLQLFWWQRLIQQITAMPWAARFMTRRLHHWDRWLHRVSHGRWTATEILAGLPVIFVVTTGAKSGLPRKTPLLAIKEKENFILIATKFGADHHPDWYYNLKANARVEVHHEGMAKTYLATELKGKARDEGWARAVAHYPGYQAYEQRAANREIPVITLSPVER